MIDKETLIGLLIETIAHWDENVETFNELEEDEDQPAWFYDECSADTCSLCGYKHKYRIKCEDFCPLYNHTNSCCAEWENLSDKIVRDEGTATLSDVEAMRNRIQRELDKITADVRSVVN